MATPAVTGGFVVANGDTATASYLNSLCQSIVTIASASALCGNPSASTSQAWQEILISANLRFTGGNTLDLATAPSVATLALTGVGANLLVMGGSNSSAGNTVVLQNTAASGNAAFSMRIGSGGANGFAGLTYNPGSSVFDLGIFTNDTASSLRLKTNNGTVALTLDASQNATFAGEAKLFASTTGKPSLNVPSGSAPTSPADGDMWYDGTNVHFRVGGTTKAFTLV